MPAGLAGGRLNMPDCDLAASGSMAIRTRVMSAIFAALMIGCVVLWTGATSNASIAGKDGQTPYAQYTIDGYVYKEGTTNGISGASLDFTNQSSMQHFTVNSDPSGHYSIMLEEGDYQVKVTASGYNEKVQTFYLSSDQNQDVYLTEQGGNNNNNGDGQGFPDLENLTQGLEWLIAWAGFVCFGLPIMIMIIMIFVIAIFVRLGRIRKSIDAQKAQPQTVVMSAPAPVATAAPVVMAQPAGQPQIVAAPAPGGKFCVSCGKMLQADFAMCPYCGAKK